MKTGMGLALIAVGAILAFAVTTNTSVFNLSGTQTTFATRQTPARSRDCLPRVPSAAPRPPTTSTPPVTSPPKCGPSRRRSSRTYMTNND